MRKKTFVVVSKKRPDEQARLMRAAKMKHVMEHVAADFDIREATADELVKLGGQGVSIEEVGARE